MASAAPLGLYVHLPWCVRKCPYCDFNSHTLRGELQDQTYVAALLADLDLDLTVIDQSFRIESVFIGGGTPSLFSVRAIGALMDGLATRVTLSTDVEVTLEANPGSADHIRFAGYKDQGINRLSIGVQTFNDHQLRSLGRIHDGNDARQAVRAAIDAGFEFINVDLMYGLPEQTVAQAGSDIAEALAFGISHVSHYQLTLEPNTVFARRPPALPADTLVEAMELNCRQQLAGAGLQRYEISAHAQPSHQCRHNLNYWRFGDYLGIGAGAHGKVTLGNGHRLRLWKLAQPQSYVVRADSPARLAGQRRLTEQELVFEFMLNRTRLMAPFSDRSFEGATGLSAQLLTPTLERLASRRLVAHQGDLWQVTPRGHRFLNDLLAEFLPETPVAA